MNESETVVEQGVVAVQAAGNQIRPSLSTERGFELLQRQARMYSESQLVPKVFQKNIGSCAIALQLADRVGADPMSVMQNLYIVHGTPSWSATFLIGCVNACGRFSPLRYRFDGQAGKESWGCVAWAQDRSTGETLEGTRVSMAMAKQFGWTTRSGSHWKTMPEQMLRYRAATYWTRTYAPEIGLGMRTVDEAHDIYHTEKPSGARLVEERLRSGQKAGKESAPEESVPERGSQADGEAEYHKYPADVKEASPETKDWAMSEEEIEEGLKQSKAIEAGDGPAGEPDDPWVEAATGDLK